ncbi:TetR/AcrR family transcriptional regulator [Microbacterium sp.]|uniref:TetR/AcrR family transcriptional regulator n=1 Tax=Microbacterium sp. TaxID=51671 RepID=UPI003A847BD0
MARPARARDTVLDAYEQLLGEEGPRGATMDAVAHRAGVSKGGLLYHFASKDALEAALRDRLDALARDDVAQMTESTEGMVATFLRTSIMEDSPLDRALIAMTRLAQGGSEAAGNALREVRELWADALRPHTRDETALQVVMLVGDGLYFNNALSASAVPTPVPEGADMDALIALVASATARGLSPE